MRLVPLFALVALVGCRAPVTHPIPTAGTAATHATVLLVSPHLMTVKQPVVIDGNVCAYLKMDHHLQFFLTPGVHALGGTHQSISLDFRAGETYAFEYRELGLFRRIDVTTAQAAKATTAPAI